MADEKEQQLREKIASQEATIANLSSLSFTVEETGLASPETKARAQLIKELSDSEDQLELLIESKRVAAVVRLQDELHPPVDSEDCPICLETIKHVNSSTCVRFHCCGKWGCVQCADERDANIKKIGFDEGYRNKCPLCREVMHRANDYKIRKSKVLEHSNRGMAWAQCHVGSWYSDEMFSKEYGFPFDKEKGLQFLKQAAEQRDSDALLQIALLFYPPQRDETKHMYYLKEAADLGNQTAQYNLAGSYKEQKDDKGRLHYITLAASQGESHACGMLGHLFMAGECGLTKSLILAKHYFGKSLQETEKLEGSQCQVYGYGFSIALYKLGCERYEGMLEIPGHSPIPESLFWARKVLEVEVDSQVTNDAIEFISHIENKAKSRCANCRKEAGCSLFMRCSRCFGAWYCGKECQIQHWKAGHKIDCIKRK